MNNTTPYDRLKEFLERMKEFSAANCCAGLLLSGTTPDQLLVRMLRLPKDRRLERVTDFPMFKELWRDIRDADGALDPECFDLLMGAVDSYPHQWKRMTEYYHEFLYKGRTEVPGDVLERFRGVNFTKLLVSDTINNKGLFVWHGLEGVQMQVRLYLEKGTHLDWQTKATRRHALLVSFVLIYSQCNEPATHAIMTDPTFQSAHRTPGELKDHMQQYKEIALNFVLMVTPRDIKRLQRVQDGTDQNPRVYYVATPAFLQGAVNGCLHTLGFVNGAKIHRVVEGTDATGIPYLHPSWPEREFRVMPG